MAFIPSTPNYFTRDSLFPLLTTVTGDVYGYEQVQIAAAQYVINPSTNSYILQPDILFMVDVGSEYQALTAAGYFNPGASAVAQRDPFCWLSQYSPGTPLSFFNRSPFIDLPNRTQALPPGGTEALDWPYIGCHFIKFPETLACYDDFLNGVEVQFRGRNGSSIQDRTIVEWLYVKNYNYVEFYFNTYPLTGSLNAPIQNFSKPVEINIANPTNKDVVLFSKGPGHHILIGSTTPYLSTDNFQSFNWNEMSQWERLNRKVTGFNSLSALSRFDQRFLPSLPFYWRVITVDNRTNITTTTTNVYKARSSKAKAQTTTQINVIPMDVRKYAGFFYVPSWSLFIANSAFPITYNETTQTYTWRYKFVTTEPHFSHFYSLPFSIAASDPDGDPDGEMITSMVGKHWENIFWRRYPNATPWTIQFKPNINEKIASIYFDIKFAKHYNEVYPQVITPGGSDLRSVGPIIFPDLELQVESAKWSFDAFFTPELSSKFDQFLPEYKFTPNQFRGTELTVDQRGLFLQDFPDQHQGYHVSQNDWYGRYINLPVGFNFPSHKYFAFYSPTINPTLSGSFHTHHFISLDPTSCTIWPASSPFWKSYSPTASSFVPITHGAFETKAGEESVTKAWFINQNITNQSTTYAINSKGSVGLLFYGRSNKALNNEGEIFTIDNPVSAGLEVKYGTLLLPVSSSGLLNENFPLSALTAGAADGLEIKSKFPPHYFSIRSAVSAKNDPLSSLSAVCHNFVTNFFLRNDPIKYDYIFGDIDKGVSAVEFTLSFVSDFNTYSYPISASKIDKLFFVIRDTNSWIDLMNNPEKSPEERSEERANNLRDFQTKFSIEYQNPITNVWHSMINPDVDSNDPTTLSVPTSTVGKIRIEQKSPGINGKSSFIFYPTIKSTALRDTKFHIYRPIQVTFFASCPEGIIFNLDSFTWNSVVREITRTSAFYELEVECKSEQFSRVKDVLTITPEICAYLESLSSSLTAYSGLKNSKIDLFISPPLSGFEKVDIFPGWVEIEIFNKASNGAREYVKTIHINSTPSGSTINLLPENETSPRAYQKLTTNTELLTSLSSADFFNVKIYGNPQDGGNTNPTILRIQSDKYVDSFFSGHIPEWKEYRNDVTEEPWGNASLTLQVSRDPITIRINNPDQIFYDKYLVSGFLLKNYPNLGEIPLVFDSNTIFTWSLSLLNHNGEELVPNPEEFFIRPVSDSSITTKYVYYTALASEASSIHIHVHSPVLNKNYSSLILHAQVTNNITGQVLSYHTTIPLLTSHQYKNLSKIPYDIRVRPPNTSQDWIDTSNTEMVSALRGRPGYNIPITGLQLQCSIDKNFLDKILISKQFEYNSLAWYISAQSTGNISISAITQPDTLVTVNLPVDGYEKFAIWWQLNNFKNKNIWPDREFQFFSEKGYLIIVPEQELYDSLSARIYPAETFNDSLNRYTFSTPQNVSAISASIVDGNKKDNREPFFFQRRDYPFAPHTSIILHELSNSTILQTITNSTSGYFYLSTPLLSALREGNIFLSIKAHSDPDGLVPFNRFLEHTDWYGFTRNYNILETAIPYSSSVSSLSGFKPSDILLLPEISAPGNVSISALSTNSDLVYTGVESELDLVIKTGIKTTPFEYKFKQALYTIQVRSVENDWVYTTTFPSSNETFISDPIKIRTTNGFLPATLNLANGERELLVSVTATISSEFRKTELSSQDPGGTHTSNWLTYGNPERNILIQSVTAEPLLVTVSIPRTIKDYASQTVIFEGESVDFELDVIGGPVTAAPISGYYFSNNFYKGDSYFVPCTPGSNKAFFTHVYDHSNVYTPSVTALDFNGNIIVKSLSYYITVLPRPKYGETHKEITSDIVPVRILSTDSQALQLPYEWEDIAINPGEYGHARVLQTSLNRLRECFNYIVSNTVAIYPELPFPQRVFYRADLSHKILNAQNSTQIFSARRSFGKNGDTIQTLACDKTHLYVKYNSGNLDVIEFYTSTFQPTPISPLMRGPGQIASSCTGHKKFFTFAQDHVIIQIDQEPNNPLKINSQFRLGGIIGFGLDKDKFYYPTKIRCSKNGDIIVVYDQGNNFLKVLGENLNPVSVFELPESIVSFDFVLDQNKNIQAYAVTSSRVLYVINLSQSTIITKRSLSSILKEWKITDLIISSDSRFFYILTEEGVLAKFTIFAEYLDSLKISNKPLIAAASRPYINSLYVATPDEVFQIEDLYQVFGVSSANQSDFYMEEINVDPNELIIPKTFERILKDFGSRVKEFHHTIYAEFVQVTYPGGRKMFNCIPTVKALEENQRCDLDLESIQIGLNELFHPGVINRELRKIYDYLLCILSELQIQFASVESEQLCGDFCWKWSSLKSPDYLPYKPDCVINPVTYAELRPFFDYIYAPTKIWQNAKGTCCE